MLRNLKHNRKQWLEQVWICLMVMGMTVTAAGGEDPIAVRMEHFTVPPSTGPVCHVVLRNLLEEPYEGTVRVKLPEGWRANPDQAEIALRPQEIKRVPFAVEKATDLKSNSYPIEIIVAGQGAQISHKQNVVCSSAPYFKPKIDGSDKEWKDAIPVQFVHKGKKTIVRTYWNKKHFFLLVEVEEDKLIGYRKKIPAGGIDGVQFSLSPLKSKAEMESVKKINRYEFLVADSAEWFGKDKCFQLVKPGMTLVSAKQKRDPATLEFKEAQVVVKRKKGVTLYECAIPFSAMKLLKPGVGREIGFSLLVHDPDGTGVRDWRETMELWPAEKKGMSWCTWEGVKWGKIIPGDNTVVWGLCSSKH